MTQVNEVYIKIESCKLHDINQLLNDKKLQ